MNFSEANGLHGCLPQFAELTPKSSAEVTSGMQQSQNIYTSGAPVTGNHGKQSIMVSQQNKYPGSLVGWPDPNALMQLCEKQNIHTINIPNYSSQNNSTITGVQPNGLPLRIVPNMYLPTTTTTTTTQTNLSIVKQEPSQRFHLNSNHNSGPSVPSHVQLQQQSAAMAEYLQKLQATTLPLTLQQLMKLQSDPLLKGREKSDEAEKNVEQTSNNILNIPNVPVFRNGQAAGQSSQYAMNQENNGGMMQQQQINPNDLNVHMENNGGGDTSESLGRTDSRSQTSCQEGEREREEQRSETKSTESSKRMKFRAKTGEIKITLGFDGSMLYCCPECSLAFSNKSDIEQHIQGHVQERKYQCKECGAMLKRKEHLDQHMRGHSDERPFKCPVCQKAFKRNEHLTRHYVIHSGDKNFTCNVCAKAFSRKDHLNKHAQTHLGLKRAKTMKKDSPVMLDNNSSKDVANDTNNEESLLLHPARQEFHFLQHIHHLQKDQNFMQTFSAFKEQALRDGGGGGVAGSAATLLQQQQQQQQQQAVNMNEILPQNARYLVSSQLQS